MTTVEAFAPAKVNLALHVTGRRPDGYHLLDSLVAFADIGDRLRASPSSDLSLRVTGPRAQGVPRDDSNLVLRAARLAGVTGAAIILDKHLPAAGGIGGGSSDAAALLRAVAEGWGYPMPGLAELTALGADMPVCVAARSARMQGIGEAVTPVDMPALAAVLVNPGVAVSTARVFAARDGRADPPMAALPETGDAAVWLDWIAAQRNDLEDPARALAPEIATVCAALLQAGARIARMSGSGATCFGLFADRAAATAAAAALSARHPGWWVAATRLGGQDSRATT
jgi:4-diphosphocytidyl-2-C-methyl-D-erythritol kinase